MPPAPCVTVVVSAEEADEEEADSDAVAPAVLEVPEVADCVAGADPVAPGVVDGDPSAAMALLRLALILMLMISSPNSSGFQPSVG